MTTVYWILEYGKVLLAYVLVSFIWPGVFFRRFLKGKGMTIRFAFCSVVSVMMSNTLVLTVGLFHLLNQWVIRILFWGGLFFPLFQLSEAKKLRIVDLFERFHRKTIGRKTFKQKIKRSIRERLFELKKYLRSFMKGKWLDYLLIALVVLYGVVYFSYGGFHDFIAGCSDLSVHQAWIYGLTQGKIFSAGVYPEGMHCFIYLMHTIIGVDVYSCMLFLQVIHNGSLLLSIFIFLREIFRNKYVALGALTLFLTLDHTCLNMIVSFARLQWSLPQEFGFPAIFLCGAFLMRFLRTGFQPVEMEQVSEKRVMVFLKKCGAIMSANADLVIFALAIATTIVAHFYATIMAFFICAAIVPISLLRIFSKRNFLPLVVAACLGLFLSVAPMIGALASGIPFQGSINWALGVIKGTDEESEDDISNYEKVQSVNEMTDYETGVVTTVTVTENTKENTITVTTEVKDPVSGSVETTSYVSELVSFLDENGQKKENFGYSSNVEEDAEKTEDDFENGDASANLGVGQTTETAHSVEPIQQKTSFLVRIMTRFYNESFVGLFGAQRAKLFLYLSVLSALIGIIGKIVLLLLRKSYANLDVTMFDHYISAILMLWIYMGLYAPGAFGLPRLIENYRICAISQLLGCTLAFVPVAILFQIVLLNKLFLIQWGTGCLLVAGVYTAVNLLGVFHGFLYFEITRMNEVVMTIESITDLLPEKRYTIVSPVDDLYQMIDYGYHEELVHFTNRVMASDYVIPTEYVFLLIEKQPLYEYHRHFFSGPFWLAEDKYSSLFGSNSSICPDLTLGEISLEKAGAPYNYLSEKSTTYNDLNSREIIESRALRWCREFEEYYPGELKTFFENDRIVCYYFKQNLAAPYQLGFNWREDTNGH